MMRAFIKSIAVSAWLCSIGSAAAAQTTVAGATLFQNVRIYDELRDTNLTLPRHKNIRFISALHALNSFFKPSLALESE